MNRILRTQSVLHITCRFESCPDYISLDDVEAEMTIVNGQVQFTILNQHYYDKNELELIQDELKHINWDFGYEFFDLHEIRNNSVWYLMGDRSSDTFNQINSSKNQKNLNAMMNVLKNIK